MYLKKYLVHCNLEIHLCIDKVSIYNNGRTSKLQKRAMHKIVLRKVALLNYKPY